MRFFSYCIICCLAIYADNSIAVNSVDPAKAELVLSKAREFAEDSNRKPAASELMNFMRAHKRGAFGVNNANALELSVLYDLQNELSELGYTVTQTPTATGYSYNVSFSPLQYQQNKIGVVNNGTRKRTTPARNTRQQGNSNAYDGKFDGLKKSIDNLSNIMQSLTQSIEELSDRLDKSNLIEDDENDTENQDD